MNMDACKTSPVARAYFYDELANQLEASALHPSIVEWWVVFFFSVMFSCKSPTLGIDECLHAAGDILVQDLKCVISKPCDDIPNIC